MEQMTCMASAVGAQWPDDWKAEGFGVRVEVYSEAEYLSSKPPRFETYCGSELDAVVEAERYERRGYVARVVLRHE